MLFFLLFLMSHLDIYLTVGLFWVVIIFTVQIVSFDERNSFQNENNYVLRTDWYYAGPDNFDRLLLDKSQRTIFFIHQGIEDSSMTA